ncbi:MAG: endonuclease/exonuclease/phosphatase family protein [Acidobacteriia bacterium]|nr:endonuclease/exonuclease/phosphatase family protein [Terriglobia bacterium]
MMQHMQCPIIRSSAVAKLAKGLAKLAILLLIACVVFVVALALAHRKPPPTLALAIERDGRTGKWPNQLNVLTWNLGYAGTGEEADFFLNGGHDVIAKNKATVLRHLTNISKTLRENPEDVYFLQEVDLQSRRTYQINELAFLAGSLWEFAYSFAFNHDVWFVPYPFTRPMGRVRSGLVTLGSYRPSEATRVQLPGSFIWPISAFGLDRCLLVWRLPREDGKEWVLINLHLSAWDPKGNIREQELTFINDFASREYNLGNFVVIGGDWNSVLPGVRLDQFPSQDKPSRYVKTLSQTVFPKEWHWGIETSHPSDRQINTPYVPGKTYLTIIDGFLVSPNVRIESTRVLALDFKDSDHEPVTISLAAP